MENGKNPCIEIIRYKIPSLAHADFEKAYTEAGEFLKASSYCKAYHIIKGIDEPDNYIVPIYWTSVEDHVHKFRSDDNFSKFLQFVKPFYSTIQEMKHYQLPLVHWKMKDDE